MDASDPQVQAAFEAEINAGAGPDEPIDLSGDGGVMKTILKEGSGWERPNKGIEVGVHYTGTLTNGVKFDSSVDRGQLFKFQLGAGRVIKGWDITVASMKRGEKCRVVLASDYAYGAHGSPPTIPPGATLVFEIELFEFDNEMDISQNKTGSLRKLETKAATGIIKPEFDSAVKVEYTVSLEDSKELVVPKTTVSFVIGDETLPSGVQYCITTLRVGAAAKFTVHPAHAYGHEGNAALKIPGNATTVWNIELLEATNLPDAADLSSTEKLTIANEKKTDGNTLFAQGKFARAIQKYDLATSYTKFIPGDEAKAADDLATICKLNAAQCFLKLQNYSEAEKRCTEVLKNDNNNIKALYRRALAYHALNDLQAAVSDLKQLIAADNTHQEAVRELAKVSAKIKAQEDRDKALFAKMFQ